MFDYPVILPPDDGTVLVTFPDVSRRTRSYHLWRERRGSLESRSSVGWVASFRNPTHWCDKCWVGIASTQPTQLPFQHLQYGLHGGIGIAK